MRTRPRYLLLPLIAAVVMLANPSSSAQQSPAQTDPPTFRITTDFVQVDVIATDDDDRPVSDLREADFEVLEDGKAQAIQQFKLVRLDSGAADSETPTPIRSRYDEEREAARDDVRLFGIFFDHRVGEVEAKRVRDPLIQFVRTRLRPLDMVATMHSDTPLVAVEFTRDRDQTVRAIERYADELRQRQEREERQRLNNPSIPPDPRRAINGLHALASRMADLRDGRKSIIYVGRGVADAFSSRMNGGAFDFDELTTNLNRSNTSVYVLDPGGLAVGRSTTRQASLRGLAYETGGLPIVGTNNFAGGLMRVSLDAGMYYLLGYTSSAPADGKFHEIKVRIRRNGVNVRARSGYWALSAESLKRMETPARWTGSAVMEALGSLATSGGPGYARTWVGFARGGDGRGDVTVAWEPGAATPGESRERVTAVSLEAVDAKGGSVFSGRSAVQASESGARVSPDGAGKLVFAAPAGRLRVNVSFEGADGRVLGTETRSIDVPGFAASGPAFSTPQVFRTRTARDFNLVSSSSSAVPSAGREFLRTDRLLIRFDSYRPDAEPRAALLNRQGDQMFEVPVTRATAGATHQLDLLLGRVPAGDYLIELRPPGSDERELIAVRVR